MVTQTLIGVPEPESPPGGKASGRYVPTAEGVAGKALLRIEDVAFLLDVSHMTVYQLMRSGELPVTRIRGTVRIRRRDFERLVDRKTRAAR